MRQTRCELCGGVIIEGRCSECGMYYRRDGGKYYLNECRPDHVDAKVNEEPGGRKTATPNVPRMRAHQGSTSHETKAGTDRMAPSESLIRMFDLNKNQGRSTSRSESRKISPKKKNRILPILLALVLVLFPILMDFLGSEDGEKLLRSLPEYIEQLIGEEEEPEYDEGWIEMTAATAIPESGTEATYSLPEGEYLVGCHLPEGTYAITGDYGDYSMIQVSDPVDGGYSWYLDDYMSEDGELTQEDVPVEISEDRRITLNGIPLREGAWLSIESTQEMTLYTENAQAAEMPSSEENPLTDSVELGTEPLTAGVDFEPGFYDLTADREWSYITITDEEENQRWFYLDADRLYYSHIHCNVWISEGETVVLEDDGSGKSRAILVPSPLIYERAKEMQ